MPRRRSDGGDGRWDDRFNGYQEEEQSRLRQGAYQQQEQRRSRDRSFDENGLGADYREHQSPRGPPPGHHHRHSYDDYEMPSPGGRSGSDRYATQSNVRSSMPNHLPSETPQSYGYGRRLSHDYDNENGQYHSAAAAIPPFIDAEVSRARISGASSFHSSGSAGEQATGVDAGVNLKDSSAYEHGASYDDLGANREESGGRMGMGPAVHRYPPNPDRGKPLAPAFCPVEPSLPMRQVDRRYRKVSAKRASDVCRGDTRIEHVRMDEQRVLCFACRSPLKVKKSAVLVKCPKCSYSGPTLGMSQCP